VRNKLPANRLACAAATLLLLAHLPLHADLVVLRNGQELRGRVRTKGDQVRIELDLGGSVVVARGDIARMVVDEPTKAVSAEDAAVPPELVARLKERERLHVLIETLAAEKASQREDAEGQLVEAGRSALPIVRQALDEDNTTQRTHVLRVLAAIGDPASIPEIIQILRDPKERALHAAAAKALADIGGHKVVPILTETLVHGEDDAVRSACLKALAALRAPFAAPFVVGSLKVPGLRRLAGSAIPRWSDPVLLPYILPLLDEGSREARQRLAGWVVNLITPAHAVALSKLLDAYKENKPIAKALFAGVKRLHNAFPVVGDIELLAATQPSIRSAAEKELQKRFKDKTKRARRTPREWQAERGQATSARLLLVPVGRGRRLPLHEISMDLATSLKVPVDIERKALPFAGPADRPRDARRLLVRLDLKQLNFKRLDDCRTARVIGVTNADITVPGLDHALAPTRPGGAIVLSLARLGKPRYEALRRARRLLLHALARSLGMPACSDVSCPTSAVHQPRDLDAKSSRYCTQCQRSFTAAWGIERDAAAFYYANAARSLSGVAKQRKSGELHAAAAYMYERALKMADATTEWRAYLALEKDPAINELTHKRIDLLDRAEKWLHGKGVTAQPTRRRRPRGG